MDNLFEMNDKGHDKSGDYQTDIIDLDEGFEKFMEK
jgi:hypothetical protein